MDWYRTSPEEVFRQLDTSPAGLTATQVVAHRLEYGENQPPSVPTSHPVIIFLRQFASPFVFLLVAAAAVSLALHAWEDAATIALIVLINSALGTYFELRTTALTHTLRQKLTPHATVRRDGKTLSVAATSLTLGDCVLLRAGQAVPADCRIISNHFLRIDESSLTGESLPSAKTENAQPYPAPLAEQHTMAFQGTFVTAGLGEAIVVAIGAQTVAGTLGTLSATHQAPDSPLIRRMHRLSQLIVYVALAGALPYFFFLTFHQVSGSEAFRITASLMVAAVPEGLPIIVTLTLLLGVHHLAERHALVKNLAALDTLAQVTTLVTDKTGTITENNLTVRTILLPRVGGVAVFPLRETDPFSPGLSHLLKASVLANEANLGTGPQALHDPLERALLQAASQLRIDTMGTFQRQQALAIIPFSSEHRLMAAFFPYDVRQVMVYLKGAPEVILARCTKLEISGQTQPLTAESKSAIFEALQEETQAGHKTLAFACLSLTRAAFDAYRQQGSALTVEGQLATLNDLTFLGAMSLEDPIRSTARATVRTLMESGISLKVASGDHAETTAAVAQAIGLEPHILDGATLSSLSRSGLHEGNILARVDPQTKLHLIEVLQKQGEIVAMAGDGANDAPALRQADVGIALGKAGNDISRHAADIILLDDSLPTILRAFQAGRVLTQAIQRIFLFLAATNLAEVAIVLLGSLLTGGIAPLLPTQILWINLLSDTPLTLPFTFERRLAQLPATRSPLAFSPVLIQLASSTGVALWLVVTTVFVAGLAQGLSAPLARSLVFATLILGQLATVHVLRCPDRLLWRVSWHENNTLWYVSLGMGIFLLICLLTPVGELVSLAPIPLRLLWIPLVGSGGVAVVGELNKLFLKSTSKG